MHHPTDRMTHTTAFVTPVVEHWLQREIAQWVNMKDRSDDPSHYERTLYHGFTFNLRNKISNVLFMFFVSFFFFFAFVKFCCFVWFRRFVSCPLFLVITLENKKNVRMRFFFSNPF